MNFATLPDKCSGSGSGGAIYSILNAQMSISLNWIELIKNKCQGHLGVAQSLNSFVISCIIGLHFEQVLDEADRLLNEDFEKSIDEILDVIPRDRRTYLFSATMTKKVLFKYPVVLMYICHQGCTFLIFSYCGWQLRMFYIYSESWLFCFLKYEIPF